MARTDAFFLPLSRGRRFCLLHTPENARGLRPVLFVHAFAEEMNRSRRVVATQARALADAGRPVLQVDLFGCGDSEGAFGEADWPGWTSDIAEAAAWLRERFGHAPILWGMRAGCLLASAAARDADVASDLLLWQPVTSGRQFLRQFLRIKLAGRIVGSERDDASGAAALQAQLGRGEPVEVAGYEISSALAAGLAAAELSPPSSIRRMAWLEVADEGAVALAPAAERCIGAWHASGVETSACAVPGPPFWQLQDFVEAPALVAATSRMIEAWP